MASSFEESEKDHLRTNTYHLPKNQEIGPVDPEIIGLHEIIKNKYKKTNQCKQNIYLTRQVCRAG